MSIFALVGPEKVPLQASSEAEVRPTAVSGPQTPQNLHYTFLTIGVPEKAGLRGQEHAARKF